MAKEYSLSVYEYGEFPAFGRTVTNIDDIEEAVFMFNAYLKPTGYASLPAICLIVEEEELNITRGKKIDISLLPYLKMQKNQAAMKFLSEVILYLKSCGFEIQE